MRLTYTDLKKAHFRNIGKAGQYSDTTLLEDFKYSLGARYQMIMGTLSQYINQDTQSTTTIAAQQYYYYPVGTVGVDTAMITIGSNSYPLTPIYHQHTWNIINQQTATSAYPLFIFPRKDDFGIWPIPSGAYTLTFNRFFRDRNLLVEDVTDGTITLTNGSTAVVGSSTVFTTNMAGRWLTVSDTAVSGQGYWYRIASVSDGLHLTLETYWASTTHSLTAYRIGESPEIPEEGHPILAAGTAADFYAGMRNDTEKATWWNNVFWTGDGNNNVRDLASKNVAGGLIGMLNKYQDRERDNIVIRGVGIASPQSTIFSQTIT